MIFGRIGRIGSLMGSLLCVSGCGDDSGGGPPAPPQSDAGMMDAAAREPWMQKRADGSVIVEVDAGERPPQACMVEQGKVFELTSQAPLEPVSMAVDQVGGVFGLVYLTDSVDCFDSVYMAQARGGDQGAPEELPVLDPCANIERAAVTHSWEHWLVATVDDRSGPPNLFVEAFDGEPSRGEGGNAITDNVSNKPSIALANFHLPADNSIGQAQVDSAMVAWVEKDVLAGGMSTLKARALAADGTPLAAEVVIEEPAMRDYQGLSLSQVGPSRMALAYIQKEGASVSAVLQVLDRETAAAVGEPWVLTDQAGSQASVELGADHSGGAVVYTYQANDTREIMFQELGPDGQAAKIVGGLGVGGMAPAKVTVGVPERGIDVSVAKLLRNWVLAYRALPGGQIPAEEIRTFFVDRDGRPTGASAVSGASSQGARVAIEVGYDGYIYLGWIDANPDATTTLVMAKLPCAG